MRPQPVERVAGRPLQVLEQRRLAPGPVVVGYGLVEDRPVTGLLDVRAYREHEPERVVVEAAADRVVAALRQRLVLVVRGAIGQLCRRNVEDALPGAFRDQVHEAEQVLV